MPALVALIFGIAIPEIGVRRAAVGASVLVCAAGAGWLVGRASWKPIVEQFCGEAHRTPLTGRDLIGGFAAELRRRSSRGARVAPVVFIITGVAAAVLGRQWWAEAGLLIASGSILGEAVAIARWNPVEDLLQWEAEEHTDVGFPPPDREPHHHRLARNAALWPNPLEIALGVGAIMLCVALSANDVIRRLGLFWGDRILYALFAAAGAWLLGNAYCRHRVAKLWNEAKWTPPNLGDVTRDVGIDRRSGGARLEWEPSLWIVALLGICMAGVAALVLDSKPDASPWIKSALMTGTASLVGDLLARARWEPIVKQLRQEPHTDVAWLPPQYEAHHHRLARRAAERPAVWKSLTWGAAAILLGLVLGAIDVGMLGRWEVTIVAALLGAGGGWLMGRASWRRRAGRLWSERAQNSGRDSPAPDAPR